MTFKQSERTIIIAALICLTLSFTSEANAQVAEAGQSADPAKTCMPNKVLISWKKPQPAEELAFRIAQECAELLPQKSPDDCGAAQVRCDAIQQETNANMRAGMEQYAYRMIVSLRQSGK